MILDLLLKNVRRILDILILVALVVAIFIWNPFGIFGRGSRIQPTANMVGHIQEMGQLITAEYYGEVIASLDEARLNLLVEDTINNKADKLFVDTKLILFEICNYDTLSRKERKDIFNELKGNRAIWLEGRRLYLDDVSKSNIELKFDLFKKNYKSYRNEDTLICFLAKERLGEKIKKNIKKEYDNHRDEVLYSLLSEIKEKYHKLKPSEFSDFMNDGLAYVNKFSDFLYEYYEKGLPRKDEKKELVMIGRGWVKAGINFEKIDDSNFYFDKDRGAVHFFGLKTEILNKDINPWFIPERAIPGFQIITYNRLVEFEDSKKVKEYCIRKLEDYALKADILTQAKENAIDALKSFFSLVSGTEVNSVIFHENELGNKFDGIAKDKKIDYEESLMIDSIANREIADIKLLEKDSSAYGLGYVGKKKQLLKNFLAELQKLPYEVNGKSTQFSFYTTKLNVITRDSLLDQRELALIKELRWPIIKSIKKGVKDSCILELPSGLIENQVWFEQPYTFLDQFNEFLSRSTNKILMKMLVSKSENEPFAKANINDLNIKYRKGEISEPTVKNDTVYFNRFYKEPINDTTLCKSFYSISYNPIDINVLVENDSLTLNKNNEIVKKALLNQKYASKAVDSLCENHKKEYYALFNLVASERNKIYPSDNYLISTYSRVKKKLKAEKDKLVVEIKSFGK